jgi:hypothetical protein
MQHHDAPRQAKAVGRKERGGGARVAVFRKCRALRKRKAHMLLVSRIHLVMTFSAFPSITSFRCTHISPWTLCTPAFYCELSRCRTR